MHLQSHPPPTDMHIHTHTLHVFMIRAFNDYLSLTHWHCPHEIHAKMAWFTKPLERGKKSHWGDGLLRGLSSRPINHSLIRTPREWGYTLRPHISTKDFHTVSGFVPKLGCPTVVFLPSIFSCSLHPEYKEEFNLHVERLLFS